MISFHFSNTIYLRLIGHSAILLPGAAIHIQDIVQYLAIVFKELIDKNPIGRGEICLCIGDSLLLVVHDFPFQNPLRTIALSTRQAVEATMQKC